MCPLLEQGINGWAPTSPDDAEPSHETMLSMQLPYPEQLSENKQRFCQTVILDPGSFHMGPFHRKLRNTKAFPGGKPEYLRIENDTAELLLPKEPLGRHPGKDLEPALGIPVPDAQIAVLDPCVYLG